MSQLIDLSSLGVLSQTITYQRLVAACWGRDCEMSDRTLSQACHSTVKRKPHDLRHQPNGQKILWKSKRKWNKNLKIWSPNITDSSTPFSTFIGGIPFKANLWINLNNIAHLKHSWTQSLDIAVFVSWKSLLARSKPWNTFSKKVNLKEKRVLTRTN